MSVATLANEQAFLGGSEKLREWRDFIPPSCAALVELLLLLTKHGFMPKSYTALDSHYRAKHIPLASVSDQCYSAAAIYTAVNNDRDNLTTTLSVSHPRYPKGRRKIALDLSNPSNEIVVSNSSDGHLDAVIAEFLAVY